MVSMGVAGGEETLIVLLEAVVDARSKMDPKNVTECIWNAFLVFALVLVPSIQGW